MSARSTDPFGGIKGEAIPNKPDLSRLPPMQVDHMEATKGIKRSLDLWDGVGSVRIKGNIRERIKQKEEARKEVPPNWNYISEVNKDFADVHLKWSGKVIRSIKHVPADNVRVALVGLSAFYRQLNLEKPDLSHPDVLKCFNATAESFGTEKAPIPDDLVFDPEIHLDPFAGVRGKDALRLSQFNMDLKKALDEVLYSIDFIDQVDVPNYRKDYIFKTREPKNLEQTYPTTTDFFNVMMWWPDGVVQKIENVATQRARLALSSIKNVLENIDVERPDLEDELIKKLYELTKENHKPGTEPGTHHGFKPTSEGGTSYWSMLTHRWIVGSLNENGDEFLPPEKGQ